ncbi:MAG TPA: hypothetical protein VFY56_14795 [Propionibacteriaceae bacterium]|nr:hypothetical protein [Propionibacteriaceae bacterium]
MAEPGQGTSSKRTVPVAVDAALGAAAIATKATLSVTRQFTRAAAPIGRLVMHPPVLNERLHPARVVDALVDRGYAARTTADDDLSRIVAAVVPPVVNEVLDNLDLTELVRERVDIDGLVSTVDIEAVIDRVDIAAIVERIDIDAIAKRIDLDAIVDRIDIDAIVDRIDIDAIVRRVDVGAVVAQVDVDAIARRIDLDAIVDSIDIDGIVRRVDISGVVAQVDVDAIARRIELDAIVARLDIDALVDRLDVDAIVRRLDLVSLAEEVVNGIDLPEIIRESTGSMASEVVRDVRMQSIDADVAIARIVDRLIRRRRARRTEILGKPDSSGRADLPGPSDAADMQALPPAPERPKQELRP